MTALLALFLLAGPVPVPTMPSGPAEMRGLWVVRTGLLTPDEVDRVVDDAARAGFNALFVQVRGRGDAFYTSRIVGRSELLASQPATFDPLARLLTRARSRGLQVHAWINVLLCAHFGLPLPAGHVARLHPDWLMVPRAAASAALTGSASELPALLERYRQESDAEGLYLSPSAPGAVAHLEQVVSELVRSYRVDGLHLDFIRYPGPEYDWSRVALQGFRGRRGGDLLGGPAAEPERWASYRRGVLDMLALRLSELARRSRPGILVSAAVVPDLAQALHHKFQAWPSWMARGIVDAVCPMAYTQDTRLFRDQVGDARALLGRGATIWAGIGAWRLSLDGVIEKIQAAREAGASGVVLFSHESFTTADMERLRRESFTAAPLVSAGAAASGPRRDRR